MSLRGRHSLVVNDALQIDSSVQIASMTVINNEAGDCDTFSFGLLFPSSTVQYYSAFNWTADTHQSTVGNRCFSFNIDWI